MPSHSKNYSSITTLDEILALYDEDFINAAYQLTLRRTPDHDGLYYYLERIHEGTSKLEILVQLQLSNEARTHPIIISDFDDIIRTYKLFKTPFLGGFLTYFRIKYFKNKTEQILNSTMGNKKYDQHKTDKEENQTKKILTESELFDPIWYLERYPDLKSAGVDPFEHYLEYGGFEGRWASPYFHSDYYLNNYVDIAKAKINPLVHYVMYGEKEGRKPSRFFDPIWYVNQYGINSKVKNTHLMHFAENGGFETNPSPFFDAKRYFVDAPDVMKAGMNPLSHYLSSGIREGRRVVPTSVYPKATEVQLVQLKHTLSKFKKIALFVTYTYDGFLRADIQYYINALIKNDIEVVLIIVSDQVRNYIPDEIESICSSVFVRQNAGFDFAAWSHTIQTRPEVLNAETLFLLNDSMIGPVSDIEFTKLLLKIEASEADIIGLTPNNEMTTHIQSYFIAIKKKALCSYWFIQYFMDIVNLETKDDVIFQYELTFTARMKAKGFTCASIIPGSMDTINKTIFQWSELLDDGIPFVKRSLVSGEHEDKGGMRVVEALNAHHYPVELLNKRIPNLILDTSVSIVHLRGRGEFLIEKIKKSNSLSVPVVPYFDSKIHVTFISPHNYSNGLGTAGRGYISSLTHTNLQYNVHPISKPFHVHAKKAPDWVVNQSDNAPDVVIIHLNPHGWSELFEKKEYDIIESARRRIGLFVWELSTLPAYWIKGLNMVDAIIAPSEYCADIFRKYTTIPVYVVPHPVPISPVEYNRDKDAVMFRERYSIPSSSRLILYAFDGSSFLARKNPFALIRAFKSSLLSKMGWHLVLKTKHLYDVPERGEELLRIIDKDPSITVINDPLTANDMDILFNEAEIYASPHCSEGFGLTIAEAMGRGKIVVATDFGGSRDFLDNTCGYPVKAKIVSIQEDFGPYQTGGQWAEINENDLADVLQKAVSETNKKYTDSETSISFKAMARVQERLSYLAVGKSLESVVEMVHNDLQYSDRSRSVK